MTWRVTVWSLGVWVVSSMIWLQPNWYIDSSFSHQELEIVRNSTPTTQLFTQGNLPSWGSSHWHMIGLMLAGDQSIWLDFALLLNWYNISWARKCWSFCWWDCTLISKRAANVTPPCTLGTSVCFCSACYLLAILNEMKDEILKR